MNKPHLSFVCGHWNELGKRLLNMSQAMTFSNVIHTCCAQKPMYRPSWCVIFVVEKSNGARGRSQYDKTTVFLDPLKVRTQNTVMTSSKEHALPITWFLALVYRMLHVNIYCSEHFIQVTLTEVEANKRMLFENMNDQTLYSNRKLIRIISILVRQPSLRFIHTLRPIAYIRHAYN